VTLSSGGNLKQLPEGWTIEQTLRDSNQAAWMFGIRMAGT
jgi:hypothetical protein